MRKEIICTVCPRGCLITAEGTDQSVVSLKGEGCVRGRRFAEAEFLHPVRILTSTVRRTDTDTNVLATLWIYFRAGIISGFTNGMTRSRSITRCRRTSPTGARPITDRPNRGQTHKGSASIAQGGTVCRKPM